MNWLTRGIEPPYRIIKAMDDREGLAALQSLYKYAPWQTTLIDDPNRLAYCILLTQPGQYTLKARLIDYTWVEILAGHLGPDTRAECLQHFPATKHLTLDPDQFQRLASGWMGNYELLGWRDKRGLIDGAKPITDPASLTINESPADYAHLNPEEQRLIRQYRQLSITDQQRLLGILDTFLR